MINSMTRLVKGIRVTRILKLAAIFIVFISAAVSGEQLSKISVYDDDGKLVELDKPAQRIITLVPHASELLYEISAGDKIVAAVDYSDYPAAAKNLPRVGGYTGINIERIISLEPDLVIYWSLGNNARQVEKLRDLGVTLYSSGPKGFKTIAHNLRQLGKLVGGEKNAEKVAQTFEKKVAEIVHNYSNRTQVEVFYQVWNQPLTTQGKATFINQAIEVCSGHNIFADIELPAPQVSIESVFKRNPEVIVASGMGAARPEWLDGWKKYTFLAAVKNQQLYHIHPDLFHRPTSRFLLGTEQLCKNIEKARQLKNLAK